MSFSCSRSSQLPTKVSLVNDNSKYSLENKWLHVSGKGISRDLSTAQFKALSNVEHAAIDTLKKIVSDMTERRGMNTGFPEEFYLSAIRYTQYQDNETKGSNGETMYESTCSARMSLQPMLQSIYQEAGFDAGYGYYQFLRDVDALMQNDK